MLARILPPRTKPSAIPPVVRWLGLVSCCTDAASEMIYPLLPALLKSFGAASIWLGAMEGIAEAISAGVKWKMGRARVGTSCSCDRSIAPAKAYAVCPCA